MPFGIRLKPWPRSSKKELWKLTVMVILVTAFRSAIADWNDVPTGSMEPTILPGDRIFVNKLAYDLKLPYTRIRLARWNPAAPGDIVVLFSPENGKRLVKRIIAGPGDTVAMRENRLFLNGKWAEYEPADGALVSESSNPDLCDSITVWIEGVEEERHRIMTNPHMFALRSFGPVTVPENHYLVMGDNRDLSADSRIFGFVARDAIVGRVTAVVVSVDPERWFTPRWQRFFSRLT